MMREKDFVMSTVLEKNNVKLLDGCCGIIICPSATKELRIFDVILRVRNGIPVTHISSDIARAPIHLSTTGQTMAFQTI